MTLDHPGRAVAVLLFALCNCHPAETQADRRTDRPADSSALTSILSPGRAAKPPSRPAAEPPPPPSPPPSFDSIGLLVANSRIPGRTSGDSLSLAAAIRKAADSGWPVIGPTPVPGALLPNRRIVAFYGNPLSRRMGILGELAPEQMLARLEAIAAEWHAADSATPVQPALHLIAVVAQDKPGRDGMYRFRMDSSLIEKVYSWSRSRGAILFLDIQAGRSTIEEEVRPLLPWLARPDVHLGIDPEFYMHHASSGHRPGRRIGTLTAKEVNHAIEVLGRTVSQYGLPPKVLVIHRFTVEMLRNARDIQLDSRVQVVINMDGWGQPSHKFHTYALSVASEPVQFTGFKLFFHNDTKKGEALLTPREVLALRPRPVYIQYQ